MKIGILALQGDFSEHQRKLENIGVESMQVRTSAQLQGLDGLIIPGGESTTIGKLAVDFHLMDDLRAFGQNNPIWGTCAGAIFIAKNVHHEQPILHLMDISIARNAFGRQLESFETDIVIPALKKADSPNIPFHAVFIRAPLIEEVGTDVEILATIKERQIVAARQGHWLATSFHPELTDDDRFHRYFMEMIQSK